MATEIAAALRRLDEFPAPAVLRLDDRSPLVGRAVVLPSAFNPPTLAHVELLRTAAAVTGAHLSLALLSTRNVDKPLAGAPLHHRAGMLLAIARGEPGFAVAATNAARLADQGTALRRAHPGCSFDFVVGTDTLIRLFDPRYYSPGTMEDALDAFFASHRVLAAERGGGSGIVWETVLAGPGRRWKSHVVKLQVPPWVMGVSSTEARFSAHRGLRPAVTPATVSRYIARHRLYRVPAG